MTISKVSTSPRAAVGLGASLYSLGCGMGGSWVQPWAHHLVEALGVLVDPLGALSLQQLQGGSLKLPPLKGFKLPFNGHFVENHQSPLQEANPGFNPMSLLAPGSNSLSLCPRHGAGDGLLHPSGCVFLRPLAQRLLKFGFSFSPTPSLGSAPFFPVKTFSSVSGTRAGLAPVWKRRLLKLLLLLGSPRGASGMGRVVAIQNCSQNEEPQSQSTSQRHLQLTLEGLEGKLSSVEGLEGDFEDRALPGDVLH